MQRFSAHILLLFLLIYQPSLWAETVVNEEKTTAETAALSFIPLSDVPVEAARTSSLLNEIQDRQQQDSDVLEIHKTLTPYITSVAELLDDPIYEHLKEQTLRELQKIRHELDVYKQELINYNKKYQERIDALELTRSDLKVYSELWSETHINATSKAAPTAIQEHITKVIIQIEELRNYTKSTYDILLIDTNQITSTLATTNEKIETVREAELFLSQRVFHQDQAPLSQLFFEEELSPLLYLKSVYDNLNEKVHEFSIFFKTHPDRRVYLYITFILISVFVAYFYRLFHQNNLFVRKASLTQKRFFFLSRPISLVIILFGFSVVGIYYDSPRIVREIIVLIVLVPVLRVIQTVVHEHLERYFYAYILLYIGALIEHNAIGYDLVDRLFPSLSV